MKIIEYEILKLIKEFLITIFTYETAKKVMNKQQKENIVIEIIINILISIIYYFFKEEIGIMPDIVLLICLITLSIIKKKDKNIGYIVLCVIISLTINYILFVISSALLYIPTRMFNITNNYIIFASISLMYILLVYFFFRIKKIKNGFIFLESTTNGELFEILFFNVSAVALFSIILMINYEKNKARNMIVCVIFSCIIMFITIQKSLQLYYKQKLLVQELEKTKQDLEDKNKEIESLEKENIAISKKNHTIDHKQKSLELKIAEMMSKTEISKEEAVEVRERLKQISKDINREKIATELNKTEISEIDDMLKYMQKECNKNKIDFELQIKGNIHYMTNNLISKEDLETLLADHIKNAIIAINHTNNVNKSILVRLGKIDKNYGLYIYDSGIEFEQETLKNLGKKPSTTHANEGGTGMGFMNTFDTLNKCKASLIIEEYNKPSKDNYTKAIFIKFDNKNEFKIKSYRQK